MFILITHTGCTTNLDPTIPHKRQYHFRYSRFEYKNNSSPSSGPCGTPNFGNNEEVPITSFSIASISVRIKS